MTLNGMLALPKKNRSIIKYMLQVAYKTIDSLPEESMSYCDRLLIIVGQVDEENHLAMEKNSDDHVRVLDRAEELIPAP